MQNRCGECGSWGVECGSETPVKGCGCARCANIRAGKLEETLQKIISMCGDDLVGFADIQHVAIQGLDLGSLWAEWYHVATQVDKPSQKMKDMLASGKLKQYPALGMLINWHQDPEWHPEGCVWRHTLHTLDAAVSIAKRENLSEVERATLVLAALCHDFGKPLTTIRNEKGRLSSPEHDKAGAPLALSFMEYIGAPKEMQDAVSCLVSEHMVHVGAIINHRLVRRLMGRLEGKTSIRLLSLLIEADHAGRPPLPPTHPCPDLVKLSEECLAADSKPKPFLQGKDLISLGFEPGIEMGHVLKKAYELQLQETLPTKEAAVEWAVSYRKELDRKKDKFANFLQKAILKAVLPEKDIGAEDIKQFWEQIRKKPQVEPTKE